VKVVWHRTTSSASITRWFVHAQQKRRRDEVNWFFSLLTLLSLFSPAWLLAGLLAVGWPSLFVTFVYIAGWPAER
jgi:hypothetical protein